MRIRNYVPALLFLAAIVIAAVEACDGTPFNWDQFGKPNGDATICTNGSIFIGNIDSGHMPAPTGWIGNATTSMRQLTYGCGQAICASSPAAARAAFVATLDSDPGNALFVYNLGNTGNQAQSNEIAAFAAWQASGGNCIPDPADAGPPACVPLITTVSAMLPNPPTCSMNPTGPAQQCCPSPDTGEMYLCRPLQPALPAGQGICVIDTNNDMVSECAEGIQCYPGYCWNTTCTCQEAGDPCTALTDCCQYPYVACVAGTCTLQN